MKSIKKFKAYLVSLITMLISSLVISFVAFSYAAYLNNEIHNHTINVNFDYTEYFDKSNSNASSKTYAISTPEHLRNLSKLVAIGTFTKDYTFVLSSDITWSTDTDTNIDPLIPIGSDDTPFYSTFDGQNHKITNLLVVGVDTADVGMFGYVANGATIKNYFLENPVVTARGTFTSYSNDGFLNRSRNMLYEKFGKSSVDAISIVPDVTSSDSKVTGTVSGVENQLIGFKKFSFSGIDEFSSYNPQIYISKDVVTSSNSTSYDSTFTLNTTLTESQYFTAEIYVEGLVTDDNGNNYYSRYTLERFKIYLKVEESNSYFVYNPNDINVYRKTIETEPSYIAVGSSATFYYNRHVVYAGIVCGHLDGTAEYIGVINGTLKADGRPIRSNSILVGKRLDDDDVSNLAKEQINFAEAITTTSASYISEESNGIEYSNKSVQNRYIKEIYKSYNPNSTLSSDAEKFFRIYGSNGDGSGVSLVNHTYTPVVNDGEGNYVAETDVDGDPLHKEGQFISFTKPLLCGLSGTDESSSWDSRYFGSRNYLQENCISMWITKESSQANALTTLLSQTGDFYLNFEFDYLFFDSKIQADSDSDITLTIKTTSKHNLATLPYQTLIRKWYYYYYKWSESNGTLTTNSSYYYPWDVTLNSTDSNGTLQGDTNSDPRIFKFDETYTSSLDVANSYPLVKHKVISIASNSKYFNTDDVSKRTPIFNLGLSVPEDYSGVYSLDLLNFSVTLTSTSGNVIGDPLTVDFLANNTDNISYDNSTKSYSNWPNSSMIRVSTTCFSKFLAGTKGTDYNLSNGVFTYNDTANHESYNPLIPGSGTSAFYVVGTRSSNSKNNKNNVTITYYNSVSDGTNNNIPYNETGYTSANITAG